eukprot:544244_1
MYIEEKEKDPAGWVRKAGRAITIEKDWLNCGESTWKTRKPIALLACYNTSKLTDITNEHIKGRGFFGDKKHLILIKQAVNDIMDEGTLPSNPRLYIKFAELYPTSERKKMAVKCRESLAENSEED